MIEQRGRRDGRQGHQGPPCGRQTYDTFSPALLRVQVVRNALFAWLHAELGLGFAEASQIADDEAPEFYQLLCLEARLARGYLSQDPGVE